MCSCLCKKLSTKEYHIHKNKGIFCYDRKAKFSKSDIFKKKKKKKFDDSNRVIKRRKLEDSQYYDGEKMTNIDLKNITQTTKD
jgi:hypothetical protein